MPCLAVQDDSSMSCCSTPAAHPHDWYLLFFPVNRRYRALHCCLCFLQYSVGIFTSVLHWMYSAQKFQAPLWTVVNPRRFFPVKPAGFMGWWGLLVYPRSPFPIVFSTWERDEHPKTVTEWVPRHAYSPRKCRTPPPPRYVSDACVNKENELTAVIGIPRPVSRPVTSCLNCTNYQIGTEIPHQSSHD